MGAGLNWRKVRHRLIAALVFFCVPAWAAEVCPLPLLKLSATDITEIRFEPGLSGQGRRGLKQKLAVRGFVPLMDAAGEPLYGMLPETELKAVSELPGIERVLRSDSEKSEIWKGGRRRSRDEDNLTDDPDNVWAAMVSPRQGSPPRDLKSLRKLAREKGVVFVLPEKRPADPAEIADRERLYGGKLFFAEDLPAGEGLVHLEGVALHVGRSGRALRVRGERSPMLGHGFLHGQMDKVTESNWIQSLGPDFMASGHDAQKYVTDTNGEALAALQKAALNATNDYFARRGTKAAAALKIQAYLDALRNEGLHEFPDGFFLKGKDDYATRESDALVTDSTSVKKLTDDFLKDAARVRRVHSSPRLKLASPAAQTYLFTESAFPVGLVASLLEHPEHVLIQQKLPIKRTGQNNLMEFRVDVIEGHVGNSSFRYGMEFYPRESEGAAEFVRGFLKKVNGPHRYLSASMDVAMLNDGSYRIIETNTGTDGASVDPALYSYEANVLYSNVLGRRTPMLQEWDKIYRAGLDAQADHLRKLPSREKDTVSSPEEVADSDFMLMLRARYAEEWAKQPTQANSSRIQQDFLRVLQSAGKTYSPSGQLMQSTLAEYLQRELQRPRR